MNFNYYLNHNSILHRINPILKYGFLIIWFMTIPFLTIPQNLVQVIIIQIFIILGKIPFCYFQKKFRYLIPLVIITYLFLKLYPFIYPEFAFTLGLRLYIMFGMVLVINSTTPLLELIGLFDLLTRKVLRMKNIQEIMLIFILVINFLPLIINEIIKINQSLKSRNIEFKNNRMKYLKLSLNALLLRIDHLVDELELIFFTRNITVNNINNLNFEQNIMGNDWLFIFGIIIMMIGLILI